VSGNFFDTNILIYLASGDAVKAGQAEAVIAKGGMISVQVLNEVANVARRKMRLSWAETHAFLSAMRGLLQVVPVTVEVHDSGLALAARFGFSLYDSMIVAAALAGDCDTLWSEDMQDGMVVEGRMRIVNPFVEEGWVTPR
jgi:predicted nucleic acid-binding protein